MKIDVNIAERDSSIELWHKRLGHMSEKGLHSLARKDFESSSLVLVN